MKALIVTVGLVMAVLATGQTPPKPAPVAPAKKPAASVPTSPQKKAVVSQIAKLLATDGQWSGSSTVTSDEPQAAGKEAAISFSVKNGRFDGEFRIPIQAYCKSGQQSGGYAVDGSVVMKALSPRTFGGSVTVAANEFTSGFKVSVKGTFSSSTSAAGTVSVTTPFCPTPTVSNWEATVRSAETPQADLAPQRFYVLRCDAKSEAAVRLSAIAVDTQAEATSILAKVKSGGDFSALAREFSIDVSAGQGGDLGEKKPADLSPEFQRAIKGIAAGGVTGVIAVKAPTAMTTLKADQVWLDLGDGRVLQVGKIQFVLGGGLEESGAGLVRVLICKTASTASDLGITTGKAYLIVDAGRKRRFVPLGNVDTSLSDDQLCLLFGVEKKK